MAVEDDYGLIDGIINNGKRDEEMTPPAEKPSVLGQISQAKMECARRQLPEPGNPGKEEQEL